MRITRISATEKAKLIIDKLRAQHGELIFHQSGGCCDGSAPMCFGRNEFLIGQRDVCLGEVHGCSFYMASDQFEYYRNMHVCIDVTEGRGASFSLEIPLGLRFMAISTLFTKSELDKLSHISSTEIE
jgi:hypothetical protein